MTQELSQTQNPPPIITIIGGGFTGSTITVQQAAYYASLYKNDKTLPPLTIRIVDKQGSFGPGLPYGTKEDVFLLNQPAYAMSPCPDDPDHFSRWLRNNGGGDENTFATRRQYGEYLEQTLAQTFNAAAAAGIPVKLEKVAGEFTDIHADKTGIVLVQKSGVKLKAQTLVLATGHQKSVFLRELDKKNGRYFAGLESSVEAVRGALKHASVNDCIAIIGTGQSMMDVIAVLDHIGYKGKIYALSKSLVLPWAFDPAFYKNSLPSYVTHYLDPVRIKAEGGKLCPDLCKRLMFEFKRAKKLGYGIGHVLTAIDFNALKTAGPTEAPPVGLTELWELWENIYGNPTPPKRYALLTRYKNSGQLILIKAEVKADDFSADDGGFIARNIPGKKEIRLLAIFNAAIFSRNPLASPLLKNAHSKNLLRWHDKAIAPGRQSHAAIFAAGPPTNVQKWGVETFRNDNAIVAQQSVTTAIKLYNTTKT